MLLGLSPKFGALILTVPAGVLGGATTALYGMIAVLGARIWIENKVNFQDPSNLMTAAVAVIIGAANYTLTFGDLSFNGIALGAAAAIGIYHLMRLVTPARNRRHRLTWPTGQSDAPSAVGVASPSDTNDRVRPLTGLGSAGVGANFS